MEYREPSENLSLWRSKGIPFENQVKKTRHLELQAVGQNVAEGENGTNLILPYLATAGDLREVVQFLKRKPDGASIAEAMDAVRKRLFDPRKVFAYEFWGIVIREDDRLKLTPLGWEFAERLMPEAEAYRRVLACTPPYHFALKWIYEQTRQVVTHLDMGSLWRQSTNASDIEDEEKLEAYASSFFHLCHAADIGMLTVGRKGQPTRLRIYAEELESYIQHAAQDTESRSDSQHLPAPRLVLRQSSRVKLSNAPRVLVSYARDGKTVERILNMLDLVGLDYEVIERTHAVNLPIADQSLQAMQRCTLGIFVLGEEDFNKNDPAMTPNSLLVEVGAALVHFERRVILLRKKKQAVPDSLRELYCCEYETDDLSWEAAVRMAKMIKDFIQ